MNMTAATAVIALAIVPALAANDARAAPFLPDFDAATFVLGAPINNPYFPLLDSKVRVFVGETPEERFELTVLGAGPVILGVQTTARRDRSFEDGLLVEDAFDYYARTLPISTTTTKVISSAPTTKARGGRASTVRCPATSCRSI